jgi:cholesterol oxidase
MTRMLSMFIDFIRNAKAYVKILFIKDWAKNSVIMLFMQTTNTTLKFRRNRLGRTVTNTDGKKSPVAFNVEAHGFARSLERIIEGKAMVFGLMPFLNAPVTAHILGGAIMGSDPNEGVVDKNNRVFGYKNMFVCDGSAISSNPGVNPALTITAVSERAMSKIPHKGS